MSKSNLKFFWRHLWQIGLTVILFCGFVSGQKNNKPVSADDFFNRGLAKMKAAATLKNTNAALKKYEEAIGDFDLAVELEPDNASFYLNRGKCFYKDSSIQRAVADFSKAIELKPDLAEAYLERGKVIADLSLSDEDREETVKRAFIDLDKAIEINPKSADFYYTRGKLNLMRENYKEALKDLNKAIGINPGFAAAFVSRAEAHRQMRDYEKSIADSTKAINLDAKSIWALTERGQALAAAAKFEAAIADYNAALKLDPTNPDLYSYRAVAYYKSGKKLEGKNDEANVKKYLQDYLMKGTLPEFGKQLFEGLSKSDFEETPFEDLP